MAQANLSIGSRQAKKIPPNGGIIREVGIGQYCNFNGYWFY